MSPTPVKLADGRDLRVTSSRYVVYRTHPDGKWRGVDAGELIGYDDDLERRFGQTRPVCIADADVEDRVRVQVAAEMADTLDNKILRIHEMAEATRALAATCRNALAGQPMPEEWRGLLARVDEAYAAVPSGAVLEGSQAKRSPMADGTIHPSDSTAKQWVEDMQPVRVLSNTGDGTILDEGWVIAYLAAPSLQLLRDDGSIATWQVTLPWQTTGNPPTRPEPRKGRLVCRREPYEQPNSAEPNREPLATRLRQIADNRNVPGWLRAEARVAAHDVAKGCDIPTTVDDLTVGSWLGVRAERRRHDPGGRPDDPSRLRAWPAQEEHDPKFCVLCQSGGHVGASKDKP